MTVLTESTGKLEGDLFESLHIRESEAGGAVFDKTRRYRYLLWRNLAGGSGKLVLVMLNPNKADERRNDPTIRRCIGFATSWGFERVEVVNLFAFKAQEPQTLKGTKQPIGKLNDRIILDRISDAKLIVAAWGVHGALLQRDREVLSLLRAAGPIYCLGTTKAGMPRHPLYLRSDADLVRLDLDSMV